MPSLSATLSTFLVETPETYISRTSAATDTSTLDQRVSISSGK